MENRLEILKDYGTIWQDPITRYSLELKLVRWNNGAPRYDLRGWRMANGKATYKYGFTFTKDELQLLGEKIQSIIANEEH